MCICVIVLFINWEMLHDSDHRVVIRCHFAIDVVLVENSGPAASANIVIKSTVVFRGPQFLASLQGLRHSVGARIMNPVSHTIPTSGSLITTL